MGGKRILYVIKLVTMLLSVSIFLCGCRYSSVVEQIVHDKTQSLTDFNDPVKNINNQKDSDILSDVVQNITQSDESERFENNEETLAIKGNGNEEDSVNLKYNSESDLNEEADDKMSSENAVNGNNGSNLTGSDESSDDINPINNNTINDNSTGTGGTGDAGYDTEGSSAVKTGKKVVDAYGNQVDIPENISKVTAVGDLAGMVAMLGGHDSILASSSSFTENEFVAEVISGAGEIPTLWNADGSAGISEVNFNRLLAMKPELCLETSGVSVFTDEQVIRLQNEGITYLVLPKITDLNSLKTNVETIGKIMADEPNSNGKTPSQVASDYISWAEKTLSEVERSKKASDVYTMYVDDWDEDAFYKIYNNTYTTKSGYGSAVIYNKSCASTKFIDSFLQYAGIINATSQVEAAAARKCYYIPLVAYSRNISVQGDKGEETTQQRIAAVGNGLGGEGFTTLIAGNRKTADAIKNSDLWKEYDVVYSKDGTFYANGFLDENGVIISTQITGAYNIEVNPSGISKWNAGSAEGVLEAVWAAWKVSGTYSEKQVRDKISEFYSLFYNCELSSNQVDDILDGEE